ncbi:EamA family transporter [Nocardia arizonensis]|uniref:EamA family transporter n=2 Tax=Nocardia arizonensis TaxID=1141647 RepID=UPI001C3FC055|nr:EamA family transporter [Nocardia arizonensis]
MTSTNAFAEIVEATVRPQVVRLTANLYGAVFTLMKLVPARYILRQAVQRGDIGPDTLIVETTSGTFGLALAMQAALLDRRLVLVSDPVMDENLARRLTDLGAEVEIVRHLAAAGGYQGSRRDQYRLLPRRRHDRSRRFRATLRRKRTRAARVGARLGARGLPLRCQRGGDRPRGRHRADDRGNRRVIGHEPEPAGDAPHDAGRVATTGGHRDRAALRLGLCLAVVSAFSFGVSGPFAKALLDLGWTPASAVLARLSGAAIVLFVIVAATERGAWRMIRGDLASIVLCGVLAIAGVQVCYFSAVQYMPVSVALLLEYLAPVLVVAWVWLVRRRPPSAKALVGGTIALVGLGLVVDVFSGAEPAWAGLLWGLGSAVCQACYFLVADRADNRSSPVVFAAASMVVGAATVGLLGTVGVLSLAFPIGATASIAGVGVHWLFPVLTLVLVSGVSAYLTGFMAISRLGATRGSLIALSEVVFAALAAWLLLFQAPTPWQIVGGVLILVGITLSRDPGRDDAEPAP